MNAAQIIDKMIADVLAETRRVCVMYGITA